MAIRRPTFYPEPWAADEAMDALTPEEMAAGYPAGTSEKPSRQSINGVLQYATNGVLYYLIRGVPEWISTASYDEHAITIFNGRYFLALTASVSVQPDTNPLAWENLPWRKSELDEIYLTKTNATNQFLTMAQADTRYYLRSQADALFLRQIDAAFQFVTQAALDANYITREQADVLFLTQAQGDARYARIGDVVTHDALADTLTNYLTTEEANATLLTPEQGDERFMTPDQASAIFETQTNARDTFLALTDAGFSIYNYESTYRSGALVLSLGSGMIYQSLQPDNVGNSLSDTEWWTPWGVQATSSDLNGMFLHCIEFSGVGEYTVETSQIPSLADHPEGVYLKIILKGPGGNGGLGDSTMGETAHGGGEGCTHEVVLQNITEDRFPLRVDVPPLTRPNNATNVFFVGGAFQLFINAYAGESGSSSAPGHGAVGADIINPLTHVSYARVIQGADGRWAAQGWRSGDGGGAHGSSGGPVGITPTKALYGCGGGGRLSDVPGQTAPVNGGDGFVLIYW